jgi:hypothetical protein
MPWCEECAKYWAPSAMRPDGTCPRCERPIEAARHAKVTARNVDLKGLARSTDTGADQDEKAPWHFKLLVVALIGYLGWRLVDLVL